MNSETITLSRLMALEDLLATSCQTVRRIRLQSMAGDLDPHNAAEMVDDVAESIAKFCGEP